MFEWVSIILQFLLFHTVTVKIKKERKSVRISDLRGITTKTEHQKKSSICVTVF